VPWVLFEAGALSKTLDRTYVIPYLIDLEPSDILPGPLTQFQAKRADREGTWELVRTLNGKLDNLLAVDQLKRVFDRSWSELERALKQLPATTSQPEVRRSRENMLGEVLEEVRRMSLYISDDITPQLNVHARYLEFIAKLINPVSGLSLPNTSGQATSPLGSYVPAQQNPVVLARSSASPILNLPRTQETTFSSDFNQIRSIIEGILRQSGQVKAVDILNMFDARSTESVVNVIKIMMADGILTYQLPLKGGSLIQLSTGVQEIDDNTPL
jgi:hypothetical protein